MTLDEPSEVLDIQKAEEEYQNGIYQALTRHGFTRSGMDSILGAVLAVRDSYINALQAALGARLAEIERMRPAQSTVLCEDGHHTRVDELLGDPNSVDWICPHCFIRASESQRELWVMKPTGERLHRWIWVRRTEDDILVCKACKHTAEFVELFSPCEAVGE